MDKKRIGLTIIGWVVFLLGIAGALITIFWLLYFLFPNFVYQIYPGITAGHPEEAEADRLFGLIVFFVTIIPSLLFLILGIFLLKRNKIARLEAKAEMHPQVVERKKTSP